MYKQYQRARDKVHKYLRLHPNYNAWVHVAAGMGFGILMTYPMVGIHPIRWAVALLAFATIAHIYPLIAED